MITAVQTAMRAVVRTAKRIKIRGSAQKKKNKTMKFSYPLLYVEGEI